MYRIVLLRHGESVWNQENRFTGWTDVGLSEKGLAEAVAAGKLLEAEGFKFDLAYTSVLQRAIKTLWTVLEQMDRMWIPIVHSWRLNERHYGALQGLNKTETATKFGDEQVLVWRRAYATPPPALDENDLRLERDNPRYATLTQEQFPRTECLKDTVDRFLPYWHETIAPQVKSGRNVIITAHGNSLRALIKYLDDVSDEAIVNLNIPTAQPLVYELDAALKPIRSYYLGDAEAIAAAMQAVANQGKMHATTPANITFTRSPDFPDSTPNYNYSTTDITSVGGAAGAPVFVENGSGGYDFAAIYLGGSDPTEVRSFTDDVETLFFWADSNGLAPNGGTTQVNGASNDNSPASGSIKISLTPSSGRWKFEDDETPRISGILGALSPRSYRITFTSIPGYKTPPPITIVVSAGNITEEPIIYIPLGPVTRITSPQNNSTVSKKGFFVRGTASDPKGIRMYQVKITGKPAAMVLPGKAYFTGKIRKNSIVVKMRALNKAGVWGDFTSITVRTR